MASSARSDGEPVRKSPFFGQREFVVASITKVRVHPPSETGALGVGQSKKSDEQFPAIRNVPGRSTIRIGDTARNVMLERSLPTTPKGIHQRSRKSWCRSAQQRVTAVTIRCTCISHIEYYRKAVNGGSRSCSYTG
jgi:hypothetical protein